MKDAPLEPESQPLSKTAYVLARLRQELADGVISVGEPLRQVELAKRYGVSPTPVREALRLLEADGSVRYTPHRGVTVSELSQAELGDLYQVRITVEAFLTQLAAERATPEEIKEIRRRHEDLAGRSKAGDPEDLANLNREFHLALLRAGSPLIAEHVVAPLWHRFLPPSRSQWHSSQQKRRFIAEHSAIVEAVEAGDGAEALRAMTAHLETAASIREAADRQDGVPPAKAES